MLPRTTWTPAMVEQLRELYQTHSAAECAAALGISVDATQNKAFKLGLRKSREWLAERARATFEREGFAGRQHLFKSGAPPWNKGLRGSTGLHPNTRRNHYKRGNLSGCAATHLAPLGALRVREGLLHIKIDERADPPYMRWRALHRVVWEREHGPMPAGHIVVFKPGRHSTDPALITLDAVELITRAEHMARNSAHRHGPELQRLSQLRGAITRQINQRLRREAAAATEDHHDRRDQ